MLDGYFKLMQRIRKCPTHVNKDVADTHGSQMQKTGQCWGLPGEEEGSLTPARHSDLLSQDHWPAGVTCKTYSIFTVWGFHVPLQKPLKLCLL